MEYINGQPIEDAFRYYRDQVTDYMIQEALDGLDAVHCRITNLEDEVGRLSEDLEQYSCHDELVQTIELLLKLPTAVAQLQYLHKGIGTATENNIWLIAEELVKKIEGNF